MDAAADGAGSGADQGGERSSPVPDGLVTRIDALCREMVDHPAVLGAGCLLLDADGALRTTAATGAVARSLAAAEELTGDGPCHDALDAGAAVGPVELVGWPELSTLLAASPIRSVVTAPIAHARAGIGALFVVSEGDHPWSDRHVAAVGSTAERIARAVDAELDAELDAEIDAELDAGRATGSGAGPDDRPGPTAMVGSLPRADAGREVVRQLVTGLANRHQLDQAVALIVRQTGASVNRSGRRLRQLAAAMEVPAVTIAQRIVEHGRLPHPGEILADASERSHREELARLALTDPLTGLANRMLLVDRLEHAVWRCQRGPGRPAVLYIDLDGFKRVNDTLGHDVGDHVLRTAAARIQAAVRPQDTVGRMGGDEFAVVCEAVDGPSTAVDIAQRIAAAVGEPITLDPVHGTRPPVPSLPTVSASIGVAIAREGQRAEAILRAADAAMYRSKSGEGPITVHDPSGPDPRTSPA